MGRWKKKERRVENQIYSCFVLGSHTSLFCCLFLYLILFLQWKQQIKKLWLEEIATEYQNQFKYIRY